MKGGNATINETGCLSKTLKTILSDTPLVKNLDDEEYRSIILDGCGTLEERFAKIDSHLIVEELEKAKKESERLHPELKKMIREPEFLERLRPLLAVQAKSVATVIFAHRPLGMAVWQGRTDCASFPISEFGRPSGCPLALPRLADFPCPR